MSRRGFCVGDMNRAAAIVTLGLDPTSETCELYWDLRTHIQTPAQTHISLDGFESVTLELLYFSSKMREEIVTHVTEWLKAGFLKMQLSKL